MYSSISGFNSRTKSAVNILIIINVCVFIVINLFRNIPWMMYLGLVPRFAFSRFMIWQFVSYLFVHAGLWHLVLNMLMLWMFGTIIEQSWGSKRFLFYYFFTGIGAGICSFVFAFNSINPVVGASGAIFGLLVAQAIMFPDTLIVLFFIFPMKMKHAAIVLAGVNLLGALSNPGSGIAYIAHLGGGLFGYFYLKNEKIWSMLSQYSPEKIRHELKVKNAQHKQLKKQELNKEIDRILDKISEQGIESITSKEKEILKSKTQNKK